MAGLIAKREAVQAAVEEFGGKPFAWGTVDCGKMVISHLRRLGWKIRTGGTWRSAIGLQRFLRRHGGSGAACLDGWGLARIPPAMAIIGDIVEIGGEPPFGAFAIVVGNGNVLAFHQDVEGAAILHPDVPPLAAWRV